MTQRLIRRAEDRFMAILRSSRASAAGSARRVDGNDFSSDRIENGHGAVLSFRHRSNAVPEVSIKCDWDCGYETVTARDAHIPKGDRGGSSAPGCFGGEG